MNNCILSFRQIDQSMFAIAGGKAANLGELTSIEEVVAVCLFYNCEMN